jgi:hypothetical protein
MRAHVSCGAFSSRTRPGDGAPDLATPSAESREAWQLLASHARATSRTGTVGFAETSSAGAAGRQPALRAALPSFAPDGALTR